MIVDIETIRVLWPELILILMASWIFLGGTIHASQRLWTLLSITAYAAALCVVYGKEGGYWRQAEDVAFLSGPLLVDLMGYYLRIGILCCGAVFTLLMRPHRQLATESLATIMLLVVGMLVVTRANDLVLLFLGLELVSIPTYVLLYISERRKGTSEAAVKYFFLSLLSSGLMLYGMSFLYGVSGSTTLVGTEASLLAAAPDQTAPHEFVSLAFVLVGVGLCFKLAAAPFHFYAPDVYQGVSNSAAAILAVAPKVAGIIAFVRVLVVALPQASTFAWQVVLVLAVATMTWGNVCALWQHNVRRLMAYSSIAHAGYMLIGITVGLLAASNGGDASGVAATLMYLGVYCVGSLGTFAVLCALSGEFNEVSRVDDLAGLARVRPAAAAALAICMFSLAGIPPLAGFWGKFALFTSAVTTATEAPSRGESIWFAILAVAGAVNAAIAAAYYLRIVGLMYFRQSGGRILPKGGPGPRLAMILCATALVALGISPGRAFDAAQRSAGGLERAPQIPVAADVLSNSGQLTAVTRPSEGDDAELLELRAQFQHAQAEN